MFDFRFAAILFEPTFIISPTLLVSWKWLHDLMDETTTTKLIYNVNKVNKADLLRTLAGSGAMFGEYRDAAT